MRDALSQVRLDLSRRGPGAPPSAGDAGWPRNHGGELTLAELERIALEGNLLGIDTVVLSAAPAAREDLLDIVRILAAYVPCVVLEGSSLLLDDALARGLREAGVSRIQVSLHGPDAETHGRVRSGNTFEQALAAIGAAVAAGLDTHVSTVVTPDVLAEGALPRLVTLVRALGAAGVHCLAPEAAGDWPGDQRSRLDAEERAALASMADGDFVSVDAPGEEDRGSGGIAPASLSLTPCGEVCLLRAGRAPLGTVRGDALVTIARDAARGGNVLDVGGLPDGASGDGRPTRPLADLVAELPALAAACRFVRVVGGDPTARPDAPALFEALAAAGLTASVVCDARAFDGPRAAPLLAPGALDRVVVPLGGAAGVPLEPTALAALGRGIARLRAAGVATELLVLSASRDDGELLDRLLALQAEQVTRIVPARGEVRAERTARLLPGRGLGPALGEELLVLHGAVTRAFDPTAPELRSPSALRHLDELGPWLLAAKGPTTHTLTADLSGVLAAMARLEEWVPRLAAAGHRLRLRRVGREDQDVEARVAFNRRFRTPAVRAGLTRLRALEVGHPDAFETLGFGPVLFRPASRIGDLYASDLVGSGVDELDDLLVDVALLRDPDPPTLAGRTLPPGEPWKDWQAGGFDRGRTPWTLGDPVLARLHALLAAAVLLARGRHEWAEGAPQDADFGAMAAAWARLPDHQRRPSYVAARLLDPAADLAPELPTHVLLQRVFGFERPEDLLPLAPLPPPSEAARALLDARTTLDRLFAEAAAHPRFPLAGCRVTPLAPLPTAEGHGLGGTLAGGDGTLALQLLPADAERPGFHASAHLKLAYGCPELSPEARATLGVLFATVDALLAARAAGADDTAALTTALAALDARLTAPAGSVAPLPTTAAPARSPLAALLAANTALVRQVAERLAAAPRSPLPGWKLTAFAEEDLAEGYAILLTLVSQGRRLDLRLLPGDAPVPAFAACGRVKLVHAPDTPPPDDMRERGLAGLCRILDHYLAAAESPRRP